MRDRYFYGGIGLATILLVIVLIFLLF